MGCRVEGPFLRALTSMCLTWFYGFRSPRDTVKIVSVCVCSLYAIAFTRRTEKMIDAICRIVYED